MMSDVCLVLVVFAPQVHAVLLATGLLECGYVCHVRAAEAGSDDGEPQIYKHPAVMISCQKFFLVQPACFHSAVALAVCLASKVKL